MRESHPVRPGVLVLALLWLVPARLDAQSTLQRAEEQFKAADLVRAEPLYRAALAESVGDDRRLCYDRLLRIYARLGRADQAIQVGLSYRVWLKQLDERPRLAELALELGEAYLTLGHYREAETHLEQAVSAPGTALPALKRIDALAQLARIAEKREDRVRAERFWRQTERTAGAEAVRTDLTPTQQIQCIWKLADAYRFLQQPARAVERLQPLLAVHDRLKDAEGKRDTLQMLAGHQAALGDYRAAENSLRQALALADNAKGPDDHVIRGDLLADLADVLARLERGEEADQVRTQATTAYQAGLKAAQAQRSRVFTGIVAFWKLQRQYQRASQFQKALQLTESEGANWLGGSLLRPRLQSEQGSLHVALGSYKEAGLLLRDSVTALESQTPPNLLDLTRALNSLAIVEQAHGKLDEAARLAQRCLDRYRQHALPDDLVLAETYNLLGTGAALRGRNAEAIQHFRTGVAVCAKLGPSADRQQSSLLLNTALIHGSQGDFDEAAAACDRALAAYQRFAPGESLDLAAFHAARINLYVAQGKERLSEAYQLAGTVLRLCEKYDVKSGPLLIAARHCEALQLFAQRRPREAEQHWQQVLKWQEEDRQTLLQARTLNYLAMAAEVQGQAPQAEKRYRAALAIQDEHGEQAYPPTHFISLWRLGALADADSKRRDEARALFLRAVEVVESARLRLYGAAQQRAAFFAQFVSVFEQLIEGSIRDGRGEDALAYLTRGRSRALLDQLHLAGLDPLTHLEGPQADLLRQQEEGLRQKISAIRAEAQLLPVEASSEKDAQALLKALEDAQKQYADVSREIFNASPVYRALAAQSLPAVLDTVRNKVLGGGRVLLHYYLGRKQSFLLLLPGDPAKRVEAYPLLVPSRLAERLGKLPAVDKQGRLVRSRGLVVRRKEPPRGPAPAEPPPRDAGTGSVPLTEELARSLVEYYREELMHVDFQPTRGILVTPKDPSQPLPSQRLDLLGNVLLPTAARQRLQELAPEMIVVVPDGALHKLPLESLLLEVGPTPRFVLDELPPLVYAPSLTVLALQAERPPLAPTTMPSLVTVANPAYPETSGAQPMNGGELPTTVLGLRGQLPRLPFTAEESQRIRRHFAPERVTPLIGPDATERALVKSVAGRRFLHVAAHGFADERFGNLFGALALTPPPPGKVAADDDGFLSLHEIYRLPLQACDVAVLSACQTNVGPQQPLEAGVTLASGFLAAGARRVVASHWNVDDQSTSDLMDAFFREVMAVERQGKPVSFAAALQQARLRVRSQPDCGAPCFWAPFVLIGPPG